MKYDALFGEKCFTLFKTDRKIRAVHCKKTYVELDVAPKHDCADKDARFKSLGVPVDRLFVARVNHQRKQILIHQIDSIYVFEECSTVTKPKRMNGVMFVKSATPGSIDIYKKSVNYALSKIEEEDFQSYCYGATDDCDNVEYRPILRNRDPVIIGNERIQKCIFLKRIVNTKYLFEVYSKDEVVETLAEMCFYHNGRYILKNKYYGEHLHGVRDDVLSLFKTQDSVLIEGSEASPYMHFVLSELATKVKDNIYNLKGFFEPAETFELRESIVHLMGDLPLVSIDYIQEKSSLGVEQISELIIESGKYRKLSSGVFGRISGKFPEIRLSILGLLEFKSSLTRNEVIQHVFKDLGIGPKLSVVSEILSEFCNLEGHTWNIKKF